MTLLERKAKGRPDNFQTPEWPLKSLMTYLNDTKYNRLYGQIWDPCCGKGNIVRALASWGYDSFGTDINAERSIDFLAPLPEDYNPKEYKGATIITNPPYSLKDEFLTQCYALQKPFALLLPLTALEGKTRQALYRKHGMQLLLLPRRVNFETPSGEGAGAWFPTGWFTSGFNFEKDMVYLD